MNTDKGKGKMKKGNFGVDYCATGVLFLSSQRTEIRARSAAPLTDLAARAVGAVEFGHGAFHIFAGGVGAGADALDAQPEIVRIARAQNGFFEGDQVARVEIEERLIERLHAVLADAGGDGVADHARLVGIDDAIANVSGRDHDFDGRDAAGAVGFAHQALADDGFQRAGELQTNLFLLGRRKDSDDALNGFRRVESVQGGQNQVAGFGGQDCGGDGFQVAHFADEDDVRVLTKCGAQRGGEGRGVHFHFALIDETLFIAVQIFDRVFNGDDVLGAQRIDAVDHGRQRGGFAGTGGAGGENQAALLFANGGENAREFEFFDGANFCGDDAQDHADVAALLEDVDTKASEAGDAVSHVEFSGFFELLLLAIGHHAEGHGEHFFRCDARHVAERVQDAIHAKIGVVADFQVQVGGAAFDSAAQQIVNIDGHLSSWAPREERVVKLAWIAEAAGRAGWKWCEMDNLNFGTGGGSR